MSNIVIKSSTTGTGTYTIEAPVTNTDRVLTLPADGVLLSLADLSGSTTQAFSASTLSLGSSTDNLLRFNNASGRYEMYSNGFWGQIEIGYSITGKTKQVFGFTGGGQFFTVPAGVTSVYVKAWGGGGGGGSNNGWVFGSPGGGAGHSRGVLTVTPGQVLAIVAGGGGVAVDGVVAYGGGGRRSISTGYGAGGGGYSAVFLGDISSGNELLVAGGGGGGGASRAGYGNFGGAGGGIQGQDGAAQYDGQYNLRGRGGSQVAGGVGGGISGVKFTGGHASAYGGGGGGGYYGGSGGSYTEDDTMAGGGGGSGYCKPNVSSFGELFTGSGPIPAKYDDPDLQGIAPMHGVPTAMGAQVAGSGAGQGGSGGSGAVIIYY